jgi:PAS domain S-box-containing protein
MSPRLLRSVSSLLALMVLGFGVAVAAGWVEGVVPIIATGGQSVPTAFNTALALALSALALMLHLQGWQTAGRLLSALVAIVAAATLLQRASWWPFDVDGLLLAYVAPADLPWLNKMAANTAWALLLAGLVGVWPGASQRDNPLPGQIASWGVATLGGLGLLGWWGDWPLGLTLGGALRMSPLTGAALFALGLAWALACRPSVRQDRLVLEPGVVLVALGGTLFAIVSWFSLAFSQAQVLSVQSRLATERAERIVNQALVSKARAVIRLAERTRSWQASAEDALLPSKEGFNAVDAATYFRDFPGLQALALVGPGGVEAVVSSEGAGRAALEPSLASRLARLWPPVPAGTVEPATLIDTPMGLVLRVQTEDPEPPWVLGAVFDPAGMLDEIGAALPAEQGYELRLGDRTLAARALGERSSYVMERRFTLLGQAFQLATWPTRGHAAQELEQASPDLLLLGLLLSFLAAMSLRLSYEARRRSAEAAMVSRRLAEETQDRLQAQHALRKEQAERVATLEAARLALLEAQLLGGMAGWQMDVSTRAVQWSEQAELVLGVEAQALPRDQRSLLAWVHPDERKSVETLHARAMESAAPQQIEHRVVVPGRDEVLHVVHRVQRAAGGDHLAGTWQDITEQRQAEAERARAEEENRLVLENSRDLICIASGRGRFLRVSRASETILGLSPDELAGRHYREFLDPADELATSAALQEAVRGRPQANFENRYRHRDGHWVVLSWTVHWDAQRQQMFCIGRDVTEQRRRSDLEAQKRMVLALIARDRPLDEVLTAVVESLERQSLGLRGSVMLLDPDRQTLHVHAAPSLPAEYCTAIEEIRIGPQAGSCGTAAYRRAFVHVDDIASDPLWNDHRDLALPHGLRACWSSPIFGPSLEVLGTLAFYYDEVRSPDTWTLSLAETGADLAGIAIQREHQRQAQLRSELRARSLFEHVPAGAFAIDTQGTVVECNARVPAILGGTCEEWVGRPVRSLWADPAAAPADFAAWALATADQPYVLVQARRAEGTALELAVSVAPIEVEGRLEGHYLLATDVTEELRKNRHIALQAQLIERSHDAIVAVDAQGRVVLWNRGAVQLYGPGAQDIAGRDYAALFPTDQQRVLREAIAHLARHRQARPTEIELSMLQTSGARQHVRLSLSGLENAEAAAVLIYGVDVTQRKLAEYALRRALVRAETQSARLGTLGRIAIEVSRRLGEGDLMQYLVDQARLLVASHTAVLSLNAGPDLAQDIHAVSLSDKYARWRNYDVQPDGSGIYALVLETGQPLMLTQEQLEAHPRFRGFGNQAEAHPPLHGWMAVPMFGRDGKVIGLVQASDKVDGHYDDDDLAILTQFAQMAAAVAEGEALYRRASEAERALQRQLDVAEAVARSVGEGLLTVSAEGHVVFSNPACTRLLGLQDGEAVDAALGRITLGGRDLLTVVREVVDTGRSVEGSDGCIARGEGEPRVLAYTLSPLGDAAKARACVAALRDITDLQRAHRHLQERNAFFNLSRDMFLTADTHGVPRQVNPAFSRVLGYSVEELVAGPFNRFVHPDDREATRQAYYADTGPDSVKTLVNRVRTAQGDYRWFEWTGSMGPDGLFYTVARDVTERLQAERDAQRLLADLERSNQELQEFAFVASHDLQEPLRKILAFADRLQVKHGDELGPQARDYIERMAGAAGRMRGLIQDLLAYSRISSRERHPEPVSIEALVAELVEQDLEPTISATGAHIEVRAPHTVLADRGQLHHALLNLLSNALKFTDPQRTPQIRVSSTVEAAAGDAPARVALSVADNGIGFDPAHAARIFQPFQRLHGRGQYEGSGIGLAIVKKIVERHGGRIDVQSSPGNGSVFTLSLPAARPEGDPTP